MRDKAALYILSWIGGMIGLMVLAARIDFSQWKSEQIGVFIEPRWKPRVAWAAWWVWTIGGFFFVTWAMMK